MHNAATTPSALAGVRVVELAGNHAAQFAARLLGDFGAQVLKVERPTGDPLRQEGPAIPGSAHSALFEYLNWNKQSLVLDPSDVADAETVTKLLAAADILVFGWGPTETANTWGLTPQLLHERFPHLSIVAVSDFGWDGPEANWQGGDLVLQAMGGIMSFSGLQNREPLKPGLRQSAYCAGLNGAYTAMAAHFHALRTQSGSLIDLSAMEVVASELVSVFPAYSLAGVVAARRSAVQDPLLSGEPLPVLDGYVTLQVNPLYGPDRFAQLLNEPRLCDERFASQQGRIDHAEELRALLHAALKGRSGRELFEKANEEGLLSGVLQSAAQLMDCDHLATRDLWTEVPVADGKTWKLPSRIARMSATPVSVRTLAPALGSTSRAEALGSAASASVRRTTAAISGAATNAPLTGLRVLDLSTVFAAPYMGALLADLGAEVIKIEAPKRLDQLRAGGFGYLVDNDPGDAGWNRCSTFQMLNRGKRSVVLDLQTPAGRDVLCELVKQSDVLIDNFTPRVMRGWGLPYEKLAELNPRLVMLSNTGYGSNGPWSSYKAQGTTLEATMGLSNYAGYAGESATKVGQSYPDFLAAWSGLTCIMAALVHRENTGQGQWIDLGMYQLGPLVIPESFIAVQSGQQDVACRGNAEWNAHFSGVFQSAGDNRWMVISAATHAIRQKLSALVNAPADASDAALHTHCAAWSLQHTPLSAAQKLQAAGVAAGAVNESSDLIREPQLVARRFFECVDFESDIGERALIGRPYIWHGASVGIRRRAPHFGEDNADVLGQLLKLSPESIRQLRESQVVSDTPINPPKLLPIDIGALVARGTIKTHDKRYREASSEYRSTNLVQETTP
ncbi:CoA transferase (plasmid) [Diaphorobacter sp. HDW4B]|uniref:CaiB/BaiF CoA transferase family protein n=1 Tax=Diaphorobacter sp. HDW4B TaxID=2714925 RepID=UPI00140AC308|nr:CoA transferase [Diaphorobacter sp. HDW4B]QIL73961.1 CoA transferase [Diaphorobacter sp. HDW4B]